MAAVVGSGIAASQLSPTDVGLQLLENAIATALALGALILTFGPMSGTHFNPVVSTADCRVSRSSWSPNGWGTRTRLWSCRPTGT
ncbi:aquaporin [Micromonospora mirobrigensis]|uniref:Major intrinsic protein n=1 Tax=Micromonospora mirobrigensis TaxID=262898 RepID=A0A1C4XYY2_9ACTN|nr:aquaporin [Micromonospora mirobrigensis]SCF13665.1 Major intrinsic protein [Micromonospora mirobrigensis]